VAKSYGRAVDNSPPCAVLITGPLHVAGPRFPHEENEHMNAISLVRGARRRRASHLVLEAMEERQAPSTALTFHPLSSRLSS
jgi:hypothetical protein